jgi:hypothetical protein
MMVFTYILIREVIDLQANKSLEPLIKRTHVSIWKWVQKYSILLAVR